MEPRRVRDFVLRFYNGDLSETFQQALQFYYANKLESEDDRKKLGELIRLVEYKPKVAESKRKGPEREVKAEKKAEVQPIAEPETKLEGPVAEQIETAREKLGSENVFGPDEVRKTFGVKLKEVPGVPFSVEELERAKKLGQMLVLRVDKTADGKPMSLEAMNAILVKKWQKEGKGDLLNTADGWKNWIEDSYSQDAPRAGWALVTKGLLPDSTSKNYLEQTEVVVKTLQTKVFDKKQVPKEYAEAIVEFESKKKKLAELMDENWREAAKQLSELKITQLTRQTLQETIYDLAMYYDTNGERLLPDTYTWSSSLRPGGGLVPLGGFGGRGVGGGRWVPGDRGGDVGLSLSRRL